MSTRSTLPVTTLRLTAAAAFALTAVVGGAGVSAASTDRPANAGEAYVAMLEDRADAAAPYSQADDYVDTLVYWHHHPDWGFGGAGS